MPFSEFKTYNISCVLFCIQLLKNIALDYNFTYLSGCHCNEYVFQTSGLASRGARSESNMETFWWVVVETAVTAGVAGVEGTVGPRYASNQDLGVEETLECSQRRP